MSPRTNNWKERRTEHTFYAEIVTDITTRNSERKDTYKDETKHKNDEQHGAYTGMNTAANET